MNLTTLDSAPPEELVAYVASLCTDPDVTSVEQLRSLLRTRVGDKQFTPRIVCLALLQKGPIGIKTLAEALPEAPGASYPRSIIEALWYAAEGRFSRYPFLGLSKLPGPLVAQLTQETINVARACVDELIQSSLGDQENFERLVGFVDSQKYLLFFSPEQEQVQFRRQVFDAFTKGRISLSKDLLIQFDALLAQDNTEEVYQSFLANNPVFLDPLASKVIPKHRLGAEFVTDFVIRRLDNKYVVVEIEKPQDQIFTSGGDFSAKFAHAFGQVLDFQQWVDTHGEYARSVLPELSTPRGLLIMGRSSNLSANQKTKLHRFNMNSSMIQVLTFEEVSANAKSLYHNIVT